MKFRYDNDEFIIEFQRTFRTRTVWPKGKRTSEGEVIPAQVTNKYPDTTVRLIRNKKNALPGEVFREATIACNFRDKFTLNEGRVKALRKITPTLTKGFRHAMWSTYMDRLPKKK